MSVSSKKECSLSFTHYIREFRILKRHRNIYIIFPHFLKNRENTRKFPLFSHFTLISDLKRQREFYS